MQDDIHLIYHLQDELLAQRIAMMLEQKDLSVQAKPLPERLSELIPALENIDGTLQYSLFLQPQLSMLTQLEALANKHSTPNRQPIAVVVTDRDCFPEATLVNLRVPYFDVSDELGAGIDRLAEAIRQHGFQNAPLDDSALEKALPDLDLVLHLADRRPEKHENIQLSGVEWNIVVYANGRNSLRQIARATGLSDGELRRTVQGLIQSGLVEVTEPAKPVQKPRSAAPSPGVSDEVRNKLIEKIRALEPSNPSDSAPETESSEDTPATGTRSTSPDDVPGVRIGPAEEKPHASFEPDQERTPPASDVFVDNLDQVLEGVEREGSRTVPAPPTLEKEAVGNAVKKGVIERDPEKLRELAPSRRSRQPFSQPSSSDPPDSSPEFTAFYPATVKPGTAYTLIAFVHIEAAFSQIQAIARSYEPMMGGEQVSAGTRSKVKLEPGNLITFVPDIEGLTFLPPEQVVQWQRPYQSAIFAFTTPAELSLSVLKGRIVVYQGPLIIGEIPITMVVATADQPEVATPSQAAGLNRLQPVFASYSHRDTAVMEYFRRNYSRLGQKLLVDRYDLLAGDHWHPRLLDMIEESAVFQLFWSSHSAHSTYCRQEWEHALRFAEVRARFIRPVWWKSPMPVAPPELADLHFQQISLPTLTRFQITASRLRDWVRGNSVGKVT